MFLTTATGRCSIAPAEARTTAGGRRSARGSSGNELETVGDISALPALALDLAGRAVRPVETATCPCFLAVLRERDEAVGRRDRVGEVAEAEQIEAPTQGRRLTASPAVVEEREGARGVEVVVEHTGKRVAIDLPRLGIETDEVVAEGLGLCACLRHHLVAEVDRLAPGRVHEEEQDRLAPPFLDGLAKGDDVAERLRHLLAGQLEEPVVHPHARELAASAARLRELVLVVREDQVDPAAVDLEDRTEKLLGHRRALDVPARTARPPRRLPDGVLALLVRLPERKVARVLLQLLAFRFLRRVVQSLVVALAAREPAVLGKCGDPEVDVPTGRVGEPAVDEPADQVDDLGDGLGRLRLVVGPAGPEQVSGGDKPARSLRIR